MAQYRLYFFDGAGRRASWFDFASTDDLRAETAARQFGSERGAELWCGERPVQTWRRPAAPMAVGEAA